MRRKKKLTAQLSILCLVMAVFLSLAVSRTEPETTAEKPQVSDHFNGDAFFNPDSLPNPDSTRRKRGLLWWIRHWVFGSDWPEWPEMTEGPSGSPPSARVPKGVIRLIPVGHATFLLQTDGLNILIDPIWSDRSSPVQWAGPRRHRAPGIRFDDLPPVDVVLVSHNHYDHLDVRTLERLAEKGTARSIVPLGTAGLVRDTGIPAVDEIDWWQSVALSSEVTVSLVPAQHFSSRTLWDRNKALWGGFVISGPSGKVYYSGDTGYGPHIREIAKRFLPIRLAILPISPFRPRQSPEGPRPPYPGVHMGPAEAVQAHIDLNVPLSVAAHFQVFQLGPDGFYDAVNELTSVLNERNVEPGAFIAPVPGQVIDINGHP